MGVLLKNGTFIHWESLEFVQADVLVDEGADGAIHLTSRNDKAPGDISGHTVLDCTGKLITKSFAVGHHHVYSALARGMPAPPKSPENFREILEFIWWRLDKALDKDTIRYSALVTAMAAARLGSTFIIDHHASPNAIKGSLDIIADAFEEVGISHLLCYEATDRDGKDKAEAGLAETERYLQKRQGLVGLHASFTVGPDTLDKAVKLMKKYDTGVHMHLAEDRWDQEHSLQNYYQQVTERLNEAGVMDSSKTILVHGIHLDAKERSIFKSKPCWIVENMESNLKNKVGCFNGTGLGENIMLGTDGMHSDMLRSSKAAYFTGQHCDVISPPDLYQRFRNVHRYLQKNGFAGDGPNNLVVLDYDSPTPLNSDNFYGHFIFGLTAAHVRDVIANGKLIVKNRQIQTVDKEKIFVESREHAKRLWSKMTV